MAYVTPPTRATGDMITASIWNQDVVNNSKAGVPDIFTTAGDIAYATGADAAARLGVGTNGQVLTLTAAIPSWVDSMGAFRALPNITPFGPEAYNINSVIVTGSPAIGSIQWVTANKAILYPFVIGLPFTIDRFFLTNGSTVSGNFDIGVYNSSFVRQISTGSVAQAGTNTQQIVNVADTVIQAGLYYLALALDNTSAFVQAVPASSLFTQGCAGAAQQLTAFPLPSTITAAAHGGPSIFLFGIGSRTFV